MRSVSVVIWPSFGDFLKGPVDITDRLLTRNDLFAIHFEDVLENTVGSRVCRAEVEGGQLFYEFRQLTLRRDIMR